MNMMMWRWVIGRQLATAKYYDRVGLKSKHGVVVYNVPTLSNFLRLLVYQAHH